MRQMQARSGQGSENPTVLMRGWANEHRRVRPDRRPRRGPLRRADAADRDRPPADADRLRLRLRRLDAALRDLDPAGAGDRLDRRRARLRVDRPLAEGDPPAGHRLAADGGAPARLRLHPRARRLVRDLPPLHDDDRLRPLRLPRPRRRPSGCSSGSIDPSAVHWWDVCFSFLYTSHFIVPFALAGVLWARSRDRLPAVPGPFPHPQRRGLATYVALPRGPSVDGLRARPAASRSPAAPAAASR